MKRPFFIFLMTLAVLSTEAFGSTEGVRVQPIELTAAEDVDDAVVISNALDASSVAVDKCVDAGIENPSECACLDQESFDDLRKTFYDTLKKHPDWEGNWIYFHPPAGGSGL